VGHNVTLIVDLVGHIWITLILNGGIQIIIQYDNFLHQILIGYVKHLNISVLNVANQCLLYVESVDNQDFEELLGLCLYVVNQSLYTHCHNELTSGVGSGFHIVTRGRGPPELFLYFGLGLHKRFFII